MNPLELLKGKNPQDYILNQLTKSINNPLIANLINMAKKGEFNKINEFARNVCKERGLDYDKEFSNFMNQLK